MHLDASAHDGAEAVAHEVIVSERSEVDGRLTSREPLVEQRALRRAVRADEIVALAYGAEVVAVGAGLLHHRGACHARQEHCRPPRRREVVQRELDRLGKTCHAATEQALVHEEGADVLRGARPSATHDAPDGALHVQLCGGARGPRLSASLQHVADERVQVVRAHLHGQMRLAELGALLKARLRFVDGRGGAHLRAFEQNVVRAAEQHEDAVIWAVVAVRPGVTHASESALAAAGRWRLNAWGGLVRISARDEA